ncbi:conserved hypothetical protein [Ricinus communis]|uniref:Uncharacterized protein n=1 Tax=Ricinus communis TaxID=3988 RepID=B9S7L6_RICCO|nr:conserved hypothetical protein [Ricinus communis]
MAGISDGPSHPLITQTLRSTKENMESELIGRKGLCLADFSRQKYQQLSVSARTLPNSTMDSLTGNS